MSKALFEGAAQAAFYAKFRPVPPITLVNKLIEYCRQPLPTDKPLTFALDVGCGSGQCTNLLAKHFKNVLGVDISAKQIEQAKAANEHPNVTYAIGSAEKLPAEDASVDLVACAQSFHWLDTSKFYPELQRVIRPGGVIALVTYEMPFVQLSSNANRQLTNDAVKLLIRNIYHHEYLKPHWAKSERQLIDDAYRGVELPFPHQESFDFEVVKEDISGHDSIGYIKSWSAYNLLLKADEGKANDLLAQFQKSVARLNFSMEEAAFKVKFPFHLIVARKN